MAKNKQTYTLQIDAELGNLESKLTSVKSLLSGVLSSANVPKGLDKSLEKLEGLIDKVRAKASQPIDSKAGFSSIAKDVGGAQVALAELLKVIQSINSLPEADRLSFLPPDAQAQINKVVQSLTSYVSAIDAATTETAELTAARKELANAEEAVAKAQAKVDTKQSGLDTAKAEKKAAEDAIAAIEDRKKKLAELYEEQKKIEEFYNDTDESGKKRNKSKKYSGVSMRPQDIARKISETKLASTGDAEALEVQKTALRSAKADIASYTTQLATANRTLRETSDEQERLVARVAELSQAFENAKPGQLQNAYAQLRKEAEGLGVSLEGIAEGYSEKDSVELIKRITDLKNKGFDQLTRATDSAERNIEEFGDSCKNIKNDISAGTEALQEMNDAAAQQEAFENKIKQFLGLSGAAQVLRSALRDALQTITELDATMTEMAVVTDLTVGDYWDQLPEYSKQASDLGVSINSAYKAATLYYQQGLKGNEVTKISAETLKMAKIAGLDAAEATDKMTAALRGFNMEMNEASAQKVADVYSQLAAITAADVDEISSAMTKTASIAHSAGMEFETTAAFLSQIIETTRESAETAGTAMKTVIARFQELKKDPSEIGEVEGEIVDANAIETALRSVGVALRDSSGQFRELDDVFLELSSKWDGLDKNTQRYIATIAAGSRQQSRFIAMMSDYGRTQELVASANNSAGASQKQFEKTTESLEYKVEQLKNAWHEFTMGIMNSDLVKFGVDMLTKFLDIINKATSGIKGLGGSLTKIISVVAVFKLASKVFGKIKQPLISFFADVVKMSREEGEKAGKAFDEGARKGAVQKEKTKEETTESTTPKTVKGWIGDKTGVSDIITGASSGRNKKKEILAAKNEKATKRWEASQETLMREDLSDEEYTAAIQENIEASEEYNDRLKLTKEEQQQVFEAGYEGSKQLANGITKAGAAAMGLGVAFSVVGGVLSSLGLEEAGEVITSIGNGLMIVGSLLSALPPIITGVASVAKAAGISTAAAWGWVALIVAGIALLAGTVFWIFKQIENNSSQKKLENAQKAADQAAEAADKASENFEKLSSSIDELGNKYQNLEELRRGTEEWNTALKDVNNSVLDLIKQYPELAGLVENKGGVLTLDINSEEVKKVMDSYQQQEILARGVEISANAEVARRQNDVDLDNIDDKIFEKFQTDGQAAATWTAIGNLAAATGAGAAGGAAIGAGVGALFGGVGAGPGAVVGAIAGGITGLVGGIATFQYTVDQMEKKNEQNRENIKELSQAFAKGEAGTTLEEITAYIENTGIAFGDAAEEMAYALLDDADTLRAYGESLNALDAQEKAYYQGLAANAQQLVDLSSYSQEQIDQMSNLVDEDLMKIYEKRAAESFSNMDDDALKKAKEKYVKQTYGSKARIDGNKIIDEKGETIREIESDEVWKQEMAAAQATLEAAKQMEIIPDIVDKAVQGLSSEVAKIVEKAFTGKNLTKQELTELGNVMGKVTYKDSEGEEAKTWDELDQATKDVWETEEAYKKSLDKDYAGIDEAWNKLSVDEKRAYGLTKKEGEEGYDEQLEEAMEAFEDQYTDIHDQQLEQYEKADEIAENILNEGETYSDKMNSSAAQNWMQGLQNISYGKGDVSGLNTMMSGLLEGLSQEQADIVMSEINSIDKMDAGAWRGLMERFKELGINLPTEAMQEFINKGIEVSGAIEKINFNTLVDDISRAYDLLNKVKENGRSFGEDDYKQLIQSNKSLEKQFIKVGDKYLYLGASMDNLTEAVKENTINRINEASRQAQERVAIGQSIKATGQNMEINGIEGMSQSELINYLAQVRYDLQAQGRDIGELGIEGLNNNTDLYSLPPETISKIAKQVFTSGTDAMIQYYQEDAADAWRNANVQQFLARNTAQFNADQGRIHGEYTTQHQDALIARAIQSGTVSAEVLDTYTGMVDQYKTLIEEGRIEEAEALLNSDAFKEASQNVVDGINLAFEQNRGSDEYSDLVNRAVSALEQASRKEIDKLSEVNDSINDANDQLVSKIQEQIDYDRQVRENEKAEQNISNLMSQQAYLSMDSSGSNALQVQDLNTDIKEAEQDYQDSLVDQAIQSLQDANQYAAEQRERQINIMEQQLENALENGELTREAEAIVKESLDQINEGVNVLATPLGALLQNAEATNLSSLDEEKWIDSIGKSTADAANYLNTMLNPSGQENVTGNNVSTENKSGSGNSAQLNTEKQGAALNKAITASNSYRKNNDVIDAARNEYIAAGGKGEDFDSKVDKKQKLLKVVGEAYDGSGAYAWNWGDLGEGKKDWGYIKSKSDDSKYTKASAKGNNSTVASAAYSAGLTDNDVFVYQDVVYIYKGGKAYEVIDNKDTVKGYKTGGMADFTGPAWLDGTPSRPEYVLNADQTERFFSLVDVLEKYDTGNGSGKSSGDNYFEIAINVDKLENDYDVEQVAKKVREMIYEDATYRNVNTINYIR